MVPRFTKKPKQIGVLILADIVDFALAWIALCSIGLIRILLNVS
jgi:hypothetical protein